MFNKKKRENGILIAVQEAGILREAEHDQKGETEVGEPRQPPIPGFPKALLTIKDALQ